MSSVANTPRPEVEKRSVTRDSYMAGFLPFYYNLTEAGFQAMTALFEENKEYYTVSSATAGHGSVTKTGS